MGKWVTLGLVAAASLGLIGVAYADVPNAGLSSVSCGCVADANGGASSLLPSTCTISPSGGNPPWIRTDDIVTTVVVRNNLGAPLAGSSVVVTAANVGTSLAVWDPGPPPATDVAENPQTGLSDVTGTFAAVHDEGGINHAGPPAVYPNVDMSVTAQGPGPGSPVALAACSPKLTVTSYDLNGDCLVGLGDLAIFASQYGALSWVPRIADFNWDGVVGLGDLAMFATNYGASCANQ